MLETILAISGKPGLYRLVNRGNRSLIVETLDAQKKRMPAFGTDKIISLAHCHVHRRGGSTPTSGPEEHLRYGRWQGYCFGLS